MTYHAVRIKGFLRCTKQDNDEIAYIAIHAISEIHSCLTDSKLWEVFVHNEDDVSYYYRGSLDGLRADLEYR